MYRPRLLRMPLFIPVGIENATIRQLMTVSARQGTAVRHIDGIWTSERLEPRSPLHETCVARRAVEVVQRFDPDRGCCHTYQSCRHTPSCQGHKTRQSTRL